MRKVTNLARIIDVFSTCSPAEGEQLLDAAKQILKSRQERNQPSTRRRKGTTTPDEGATS